MHIRRHLSVPIERLRYIGTFRRFWATLGHNPNLNCYVASVIAAEPRNTLLARLMHTLDP